MPVTSNSPPARSGPTVDTSRAQPRTDAELRAQRETISQPRNVLVSGGSEALVNKRALLDTHRLHQAVIKQVGTTSARLQAPLSPSASAAAHALAKPAPNLFERFAQAVSTAYHQNRASSAASDLAKQIKSGRFDASSVDLMASLMQHAAHLDPAAKAFKHPAIALLQTELAGADGATLDKVRNSPVFEELRAAAQTRLAGQKAMVATLESLGILGSDPDSAPKPPPTASAARADHAANRHLDRMQLILGHALRPDPSAGPAPQRLSADPDDVTDIDQQVRARWLSSVKSQTDLATALPAANLPTAQLDPAKLNALRDSAQDRANGVSRFDRLVAGARDKLHLPTTTNNEAGRLNRARAWAADEARARADTPERKQQRSLEAEHIARDGLSSLLSGMDEPTRRQELLNVVSQGGYLARGALMLLGGENRVTQWNDDPENARTGRDGAPMSPGLPLEVSFGGRRYQFERELGAGAAGQALRYRPMVGDGPAIVLKASLPAAGLRLGEVEPEGLASTAKEYAINMQALGGDRRHPNVMAAQGVIVAHMTGMATSGGEPVPESISIFTVMEEAQPGPEGLVRSINDLRVNGTISEKTHSLLLRSLFAQMVEGAAHLEDLQIAHRDLKWDNMLLGHDGRVMLMDFGASDRGHLERSYGVVGSPLWMSPELSSDPENAQKVDTWALGVMWQQMNNSLTQTDGGLAADPELERAAVLNQRTPDGQVQRDGDFRTVFELQDSRHAWAADPTNRIHERAPVGNLDGIEQLTNAMLHPDQAERPTLAALRNHHAIADPDLQDPRLNQLMRAILAPTEASMGPMIALLDQELASPRLDGSAGSLALAMRKTPAQAGAIAAAAVSFVIRTGGTPTAEAVASQRKLMQAARGGDEEARLSRKALSEIRKPSASLTEEQHKTAVQKKLVAVLGEVMGAAPREAHLMEIIAEVHRVNPGVSVDDLVSAACMARSERAQAIREAARQAFPASEVARSGAAASAQPQAVTGLAAASQAATPQAAV